MIYELRIDCFFTDESTFNDAVDKLEDTKGHMAVINPGEENQQCSVIDQMYCHHDETPTIDCELFSHWDNCP